MGVWLRVIFYGTWLSNSLIDSGVIDAESLVAQRGALSARCAMARQTWSRPHGTVYRLSIAMGVIVATEYCRGGVNERFVRHCSKP